MALHQKFTGVKYLHIIFKIERANVVLLNRFTIFTTVFHRILDFKNGAGFLSWPLFFFGE
jgi:hypothetical protein